jgi:mannose-binding lectin 2
MAVNLNGVESYRMDKDGASQEVAGCSFDIRKATVATKFRFTYVKDVFTELAIHYEEWDNWETCFKLGNLTVPANPFIGFSAATGDVSDNHEIISVSTSNVVYKQRNRKELEEAKLYHLGDPKKTKSKKLGSLWGGSGNTDSGGHSYNGNAGSGLLKRFFLGLFSFAWTLFKWGAAISLVGAGGYAYYMRKKKFDVSFSYCRLMLIVSCTDSPLPSFKYVQAKRF